jgi:hypothetical protein
MIEDFNYKFQKNMIVIFVSERLLSQSVMNIMCDQCTWKKMLYGIPKSSHKYTMIDAQNSLCVVWRGTFSYGLNSLFFHFIRKMLISYFID